MVGRPDLEIPCWAVFVCNTPLATTTGVGEWAKGNRKANLEKAKQLLKESGYDGRPIVMLDPTDQALITRGFSSWPRGCARSGPRSNLQAMVWASVLSRRQVKDAPGPQSGGWNIFSTWGGGVIIGNPLANPWAASPCDGKNWFGWVCDEDLEKMRLEFITATGPQRDELVKRYQTRFYETVPYIILGQYMAPIAYRKMFPVFSRRLAWFSGISRRNRFVKAIVIGAGVVGTATLIFCGSAGAKSRSSSGAPMRRSRRASATAASSTSAKRRHGRGRACR